MAKPKKDEVDDKGDEVASDPKFVAMDCPVILNRIFHVVLPDGRTKEYQAVPGGAIEV